MKSLPVLFLLTIALSSCGTLAKYEKPPVFTEPVLTGSVDNDTASGGISGGMTWGDLQTQIDASFGATFDGAIDTRVKVVLDLGGLDAWVELTGTVSPAGDSLRICAQAPLMQEPVCQDVSMNDLPTLPPPGASDADESGEDVP